MATNIWNSTIEHSSDATFRIWGSELNSKLAAIGLVQTADTGQINWSTVNRPSTLTDAGYEIWRFNDTQQGTSPIYIKLLYGTGTNATNPRLGFQVGSATNGSGTMTGQNTAPSYVYTVTAPPATPNYYLSYLSYSDGFFALFHKYGGYSAATVSSSGITSGATAYLIIARTVDSTTQSPTSEGATVYCSQATGSPYNAYSQLRFTATSSNTTATTIATWCGCIVPGTTASTASVFPVPVSNSSSPAPRAFIHWSYTPQIRPMIGICTANMNDIPMGTKFTTTLFGSTARTYLAMGPNRPASTIYVAPCAEASSSTNYGVCILWE